MKCKLGDIAEVTMGQSPKSEFYNADGNGTPFLQGNRTFGSKYPTFDTFTTFVTKQGRAGDVIMSVRAPVGDVNITPVDICLGRGVCSLRMKNGSQEFLYYMMRHYAQALINRESGTVFGSVNKNDVNGLDVEVPSEETQRKIAAILSALDDKIELNRRVNANLYAIIDAYYSRLLGDITEETTIGEYAEKIYSGGTPNTSNASFWNGNLGWLSSGETRNSFVISTEKKITQTGVDNSSTKLARKYDIVIASAGQGFTRGQTSMLLIDTYVNQSVIVIHSDRRVSPYLFWNLRNRYEELRALSDSNSIRGSLTTKMISDFGIAKCCKNRLEKFTEYAWPTIAEIENNLMQNAHLIELRDALLPQLMSGEIDVSCLNI